MKKLVNTRKRSVVDLEVAVEDQSKKRLDDALLIRPAAAAASADSAGLRVSALIDEIATEIAIVIANCW